MAETTETVEAPSPALPNTQKGWWPTILGGLVTTALSLGLCYYIEEITNGDLSLMGLYWFFIIPIGALAVGAGAGSGYGLVAWLHGLRPTRNLMIVAGLLQVWAYGTAQYLTYQQFLSNNPQYSQVNFFQYYDAITQSISFTLRGQGSLSTGELGVWGYGVRLLELAGFTIGGVWILWLLLQRPYCNACQAYMRRKLLRLIVAGADAKKYAKALKKGNPQNLPSPESVAQAAEQTLVQINELAQGEDPAAVRAAIDALPNNQRQIRTAPAHIALHLHYCPRCHDGELVAKMMVKTGSKFSDNDLTTVRVPSATVQQLTA